MPSDGDQLAVEPVEHVWSPIQKRRSPMGLLALVNGLIVPEGVGGDHSSLDSDLIWRASCPVRANAERRIAHIRIFPAWISLLASSQPWLDLPTPVRTSYNSDMQITNGTVSQFGKRN